MEFFTQAVERQPRRQEPRREAAYGRGRYRPYRLKTHSASCQCTKVGRKGAMKCLGYSTR